MKAIVNTIYGSADVLQLKEIPKPVPKDREVLIKIHATTVNRTDCGFLSGKPLLVRPFSGLFRPKNKILGSEFSGEIEEIGKAVNLFKVGEKVFGYNDLQFGAHAQYILMDESAAITTLPQNMTFDEAAPLTEGAHYAWCDIRAAKIKAGQKVLVNGATGAIGSAAVQLIRHLNAEVVAVCNTQNVSLVKLLGANQVIDYSQQDFTKIDQQFDVIFDAVGKSSFGLCKPLLKKKGIYISTELGPGSQNPFLAMITPLFGGKKVLFPIPSINKNDVLFFKELAEAGTFKPVIDRHYPLDQIRDAYNYVSTGQKTGNVIIQVKHD